MSAPAGAGTTAWDDVTAMVGIDGPLDNSYLHAAASGLGTNADELELRLSNGGSVEVATSEDSTRISMPTSEFADDSWHHLTAVRDSVADQVIIYVNGIEQGRADTELNPLEVEWLMVGNDLTALDGEVARSLAMHGSLDTLLSFDRTLSPDEILELVQPAP